MGPKKRNVGPRSKAAASAAKSPSTGGDAGSVNTAQNVSRSSSSAQELAANLAIESIIDYSVVKVECEKALNAVRRGNHAKALRLIKDMCVKHKKTPHLPFIHRMEATICMKIASIIDGSNGKQRHLKSAIESAKKAVMLLPSSIEFAHYYAKLLYEAADEGKDYEEVVNECERALAIENPIDPQKGSLQDESHKKYPTADARIEQLQKELRTLIEKSNIASISTWMKNLGDEEEKFRLIPIKWGPKNTNNESMSQAQLLNEINQATNWVEDQRKEIEAKVAAARLLQQRRSVLSSGSGQQMQGERGKIGKVTNNALSAEKRDCVRRYWKSMGLDSKKDLLKIRVSDLEAHFSSLRQTLPFDVVEQALSFPRANKTWKFWRCWRCSEKFADPEVNMRHIRDTHMDSHFPKVEAVVPSHTEWTEKLLNLQWKALDVNAAIRMIKPQSISRGATAIDRPNTKNDLELSDDRFLDDDCTEYTRVPDVVLGGCDQNQGWPLSDDIERTKLLEQIQSEFQFLIKHKCLAASHVDRVVQLAEANLPSQLLDCEVAKSPICVCFLGEPELKEVLVFLKGLAQCCEIGRFSEKFDTWKDSVSRAQEIELAEKMVFDEDGSHILLEGFLPCQETPTSHAIAAVNIGSGKGLVHDDDSLLSWILSGPTDKPLKSWALTRGDKLQQGIDIIQMIDKESHPLQHLCEQKLDILSEKAALQIVECRCLGQDAKRQLATNSAVESYESVLRKRQEELANDDTNDTSRYEMDALTSVLKEAGELQEQFRFEEAHSSVDSHTCDLESGESDDEKAKDSLHQFNSFIKVAIHNHRERVTGKLCRVDVDLMINCNEMDKLEAKLASISADNFGLVVLPLVNSFLQDRLADLAEKDAREKSEAASEALLAELALDSKKGANCNSKCPKDKLKNKRKNKGFRKTKDSKAASYDELPALPDVNAENASSSPLIVDGQQPETVAEIADTLNQQEDEARRREIDNEVKAQARKLEENLEYQRRFEEDAKEKDPEEQLENNPRVNLIKKGLVQYVEIQFRHNLPPTNIENPVDNEYKPSRQEPLEQNNVLLSKPEDVPGEAKDGAQGMTGTLEDGSLLSDQRTRKRGRRRKKATKLKEGEKGDDEERIQAVEQSLGEDSCVASSEVTPDNVDGTDVYGSGLTNEIGEYNCFLNVIIQSLWHLRRFREEFIKRSTSHLHVGDPCVTCALHEIFIALNKASTDDAVAPTTLRIALSNLYPNSNFFQKGQMNDASEVMGELFDCLHQSSIYGTDVSNSEPVEDSGMGSWDCANGACTAHNFFGMDIFERMNCDNCGLESRRLKYTSFFHQINANAIRTIKVMHPESSFEELLDLVDKNHQLACDPENGGCGKLNNIDHILSTPPHVFVAVLGWQKTNESVEDIKATLAALTTEVDIRVFYGGPDPINRHSLASVVCYCGQHYNCFSCIHDHERWVMYDDETVKVIGRWEDVVKMCQDRQLQPQVLFYEAVN